MTTTSKKRILIIEDDAHIADGLQLNLVLQGYEVSVSLDGNAGLKKWQDWNPDLIILDLMLPGIDGISVLKYIRKSDERLPILILSAKNASNDKVKGLSYGVDDYITKPFNLEEFMLRVERLLVRDSWAREESLQRLEAKPSGGIYQFGENRINFDTLTARGRYGKIQLTELETRLLWIFVQNRGRPLHRSQLLEEVWGYNAKTSTRTLDNFIVRFRKYFEANPKKPVYFKSLRSVGYIFDHNSI
jgi:DNA-binding response OmpR family regulator